MHTSYFAPSHHTLYIKPLWEHYHYNALIFQKPQRDRVESGRGGNVDSSPKPVCSPAASPDRLSERDLGLSDDGNDGDNFGTDEKKKSEDVFAKPKIGPEIGLGPKSRTRGPSVSEGRQPAPFEDTKENQIPPPTPGAGLIAAGRYVTP